MKGPGIFWMLQTAAGLSMAGPMVIIGVSFLQSGELLFGLGFVALGVLALFFPSWLVRRIGGPRTWIRRRFQRESPDENDTSGHDDTAGLWDRLRRN